MDKKYLLAGSVVLLSLLAMTAFLFTQGTFLTPPSNCEWDTVRNPDTNMTYTTMSEFKTDAIEIGRINETQFNKLMENRETRFTDVDGDGAEELQMKLPDVSCGEGTAEVAQ